MLKKNKIAPPSEFARYSVIKQNIPDKIRSKTRSYIYHLNDLLNKQAKEIPSVKEVLSLPYGRGWDFKSAEQGIRIIVYGSFRSKYKIVITMAELLADFYVETLFTPIIFPIENKVWREYYLKEKRFINQLSSKAIINYSELLYG